MCFSKVYYYRILIIFIEKIGLLKDFKQKSHSHFQICFIPLPVVKSQFSKSHFPSPKKAIPTSHFTLSRPFYAAFEIIWAHAAQSQIDSIETKEYLY
jgi:hypothetical protein